MKNTLQRLYKTIRKIMKDNTPETTPETTIEKLQRLHKDECETLNTLREKKAELERLIKYQEKNVGNLFSLLKTAKQEQK